MGQSGSEHDKGFYSGMFRSAQALGKAIGALVVATGIGPGWIESWRTSDGGSGHTNYWLVPIVGYLLPLVASYGFFLLAETCFVKEDKRGWEGKDDITNGMSLYINCCARGGIATYQSGYKERKSSMGNVSASTATGV